MNFLQLCQATHQELGLDEAGAARPSTVANQVGRLGQVVSWVRTSYEEIQSLHRDWLFRRSTGGFLTVAAGQSAVTASTITTALTTFEEIAPFWSGDRPFIMCHKTSIGADDRQPMWMVDYEEWRGRIDRQPFTSGRPSRFTIYNDQAIQFDHELDEEYLLAFDYVRTVATLTADGDIPIFPRRFHLAIVYAAAMKYAGHAENGRLLGDMRQRYNGQMVQMKNHQLPPVDWRPYPLW